MEAAILCHGGGSRPGAEQRSEHLDAALDHLRRRGGETHPDVGGIGAEAGPGSHEQAPLHAIREEASQAPLVQPARDVEEEEGAAARPPPPHPPPPALPPRAVPPPPPPDP